LLLVYQVPPSSQTFRTLLTENSGASAAAKSGAQAHDKPRQDQGKK